MKINNDDDDDDHDHDDDDDRYFFAQWLTDKRSLVLFPAGTIVRDSHYRKICDTLQAGFQPALNHSSGFGCPYGLATIFSRLNRF